MDGNAVTNAVTIAVPTSLLWEASTRVDPFARQRALGDSLAAQLAGRGVEVSEVVVFSDADGARELARSVGPTDAVIVLQAMGVQPAITLAFLEHLAGVPVVVVAALQESPLTEDFAHADIVHEGATVGTPMLTSVLIRRGIPFDLIAGPLQSESTMASLESSVRGAVVASVVRRSRMAVVGQPIPGYDCVTVDPERLRAAVGIQCVPIAPAEFRREFSEMTEDAVRQVRSSLSASCRIASAGVGLERSLRAVAALERLAIDQQCRVGVMNCHVDDIRFGPDVGIAPCLALGEATTNGIPWTCSGDALTAVAMLVVKTAGFPALYHELETVDVETGEFVISNSGEHDRTWPSDSEAVVHANDWFAGDATTGVCLVYDLKPGPACLVSFAQSDAPPGFRFIIARGEITDRHWPAVGTLNGSFRFRGATSRLAVERWREWCLAGSNHHSVLSTAGAADAVMAAAKHLGVDVIEVC